MMLEDWLFWFWEVVLSILVESVVGSGSAMRYWRLLLCYLQRESGWWWWSFIRHLGNLSLLALTPMRLEAFAQLLSTAKAARVDRLRLFMAHRLSHYLKHGTLAFIVPYNQGIIIRVGGKKIRAERFCFSFWSSLNQYYSQFGLFALPQSNPNQYLAKLVLSSVHAISSFTSTPYTTR